MADDIINELETELSREKEIMFIKKNKYYILSIIILILASVIGYQYYKNSYMKKIKSAANEYYNVIQDYNNIENITNNADIKSKLSENTILNVPNYQAMLQLIKFNNAQKNDADTETLLEITQEYFSNDMTKTQTVHDSLLRLLSLSLKTNNVDFEALEEQFATYLNHQFAFKEVAYELLFLLSMKENKSKKAKHYLDLLKQHTKIENMNKIKIYATHPALLNTNSKNINETNKEDK